MFRNKHDGPLNASAEVMRMPPFQELVGPIIRYITANNLRRTVFLAPTSPSRKTQIDETIYGTNVVVCQVSSVDKDLRHPDYIENKIRPLCDDCLGCRVFRVELLGASYSLNSAAGHALPGQEWYLFFHLDIAY